MMITRLIAQITPIQRSNLQKVVFPIQIVRNDSSVNRNEITLLKSTDKDNLYNSIQIDVYGCELIIKNNHTIWKPDNINNILAKTILDEFLTILGFCLGFMISTELQSVAVLPMSFDYLPETQEEKRQLEELPKIRIAQSYIGVIITSNSTTNEDISNYYNLLDPISFYMNAEKANSPILKIREYLRIFEFFNNNYKDDSRFPNKGKEELTRDIIKEFTCDKNITADAIKRWWTIDDKCSHGKKNYITSLDSEGLKEVNEANKEIRPLARLLIEKIASAGTCL